MASKACCDAGPPHQPDGREQKGRESTLPDGTAVYVVGDEGTKGIVVIPDIFGFHLSNVREVADRIAAEGMRVMLPDVFRGNFIRLEDFPPKDGNAFMAWVGVQDGNVPPIMSECVKALKSQGCTSVSAVGFCWGGSAVLTQAGTGLLASGVSVHGAFLTADKVEVAKCPMLFMPAGDDPSTDDLKVILDKKPFGHQCAYRRFDDQTHGFCAARGDWTNPAIKHAADEAINEMIKFFKQV
eukprot:jgi/Mesvir1/17636/Mv08858-RA.1